jgi:hypothetical protein
LGTSASSASVRSTGSIAKPLLDDLGIDSNARKREATRNSCSKKPRYLIYIPSLEIRRHKGNIPSAKIVRFL